MRTAIPACTVLLALLVVPTAAAGSDATKKKLAAGEILTFTEKVPGSDVPKLKAMGVVDAPGDAIWAIVERCGDYARTMIRTEKAEEISREGNKVRCRVTIEMPFPLKNLTAVTDAIHTVDPGKRWERKWTLVEGDYERNDGSWTLVPFDDDGKRTLVVYQVHAVPDIKIPSGIQRLAQKKSIPNLYEHLRESLE